MSRRICLADDVWAEVVAGDAVLPTPRWFLEWGWVVLSTADSLDSWSAEHSNTVGSYDMHGSGYDWLVFGKENLKLRQATFQETENLVNSLSFATIWCNCSTTTGSFRLSGDRSFCLEGLDARWVHPEGWFLANFRSEMAYSAQHAYRVRVAPDFYFLFSDDRYFGWLMDNPVNHIADSWKSDGNVDPAWPSLSLAVAEYVGLISNNHISLILDDDEFASSMLVRLKAIHAKMENERKGKVVEIIQRKIRDVVDRFYDDGAW